MTDSELVLQKLAVLRDHLARGATFVPPLAPVP